MKLLLLSFIFSVIFASVYAHEIVKDQAWLKNYFAQLKKTYDKRVVPTNEKDPSSALKVVCSMFIMDISNVNDHNMDFAAQFYFRQKWNDSRLRYTDRNEVITLQNAEEVWTPDLFFTSGIDGKLNSIIYPNAFLKIFPSGQVFYSVRVTVTFSCPMDLRYFPHDTQKCAIRVESYGHQYKEIDLQWEKGYNAVGASDDILLHNFDLNTLEDYEEYELNVTTGQYKVLSVGVTFQRKFGFYAIKLYIPLFLLVSLSFASLWIKAEERSIRMLFLVLIIYVMINVSWEATRSLPSAPYMKGTDIWIGFCKALVFTIFLEFIAVALISGRTDSDSSENRGEILLNIESDAKEQPMKSDTLKSHIQKLVNMFDARNGGKEKRNLAACRIDKVFRIVFPVIFILFNIIYWSVYCCK